VTNWEVTLVNTKEPFDIKTANVTTDTIVEAHGEAETQHPGYWVRSARFHHTDIAKEFGHGYGPLEAQAL
jgi:hypothetical protein